MHSDKPDMASTLKTAKAALRLRMKDILKSLESSEKIRQSSEVTQKVLRSDDYQRAERLALFLSMDDEIDTREILYNALETGKICFIPRYDSKSRQMEMVRLHSRADYDQLPETSWKIKQPPLHEEREQALTTGGLDLVLVPGLAFTSAGHRLGRGRGYYDTFLSKLPSPGRTKLLALAFSEQLVDDVPTDASDVRVHAVITP
ncbi:hypothetical protein HAZT_HAZT000561 [Hyalella azteca]|uniref:5-formyltetrahydrofolate cyclo-ligase n=1 Tax=Hyalella azteca TaxID=294128 RepID=A0A6A0HDA4_HYAAZ|nr:5-formyltetrahydrofolate cyclo-ligase-like [Hyalella azteca]KAA0203798.1 hypothetical protein HAZT_HAZT000561 [Hyalella azteca]